MKKPRLEQGPYLRTHYSAGLVVSRSEDYYATNDDLRFMGIAIKRARQALALKEVPVGVCLVSNANPAKFWSAHSTTVSTGNEYRHAEFNVTQEAEKDGFRMSSLLPRCVLYATVEPCVGDSYFLSHSGIGSIVAAARYDDIPDYLSPRGVKGSTVLENSGHTITVVSGIRLAEVLALMVPENKFHQSNPQLGN